MLKEKRNEIIVQLMGTDLFHLDYEQLISLTNVIKLFHFFCCALQLERTARIILRKVWKLGGRVVL